MTSHVYVKAWGLYAGTWGEYTADLREQARAEGAPETALYKRRGESEGSPEEWFTLEKLIFPKVREKLEAAAKRIREDEEKTK